MAKTEDNVTIKIVDSLSETPKNACQANMIGVFGGISLDTHALALVNTTPSSNCCLYSLEMIVTHSYLECAGMSRCSLRGRADGNPAEDVG